MPHWFARKTAESPVCGAGVCDVFERALTNLIRDTAERHDGDELEGLKALPYRAMR